MAAVIREMLPPVRAEAGCLGIEIFPCTRDPAPFLHPLPLG